MKQLIYKIIYQPTINYFLRKNHHKYKKKTQVKDYIKDVYLIEKRDLDDRHR